MSITLQAAPAHQDANSYVRLDEAEDYFDERTDTKPWTSVNDDEKKRVLILATSLVDSYRFFHSRQEDDQNLKHPRSNVDIASGKADSGSMTTVVDSSFANNDLYTSADWIYGSIKIINGTNKTEVRQITDFDVSTGTFTTDAFSSAVDNTSSFRVIDAIPEPIREATMEIAIWLLDKGLKTLRRDQSVKSTSIGKMSKTFRNQQFEIPLPAMADIKLKRYINRTGKIV